MRKMLQKHFIPTVENDYAPHILRKTAVCGLVGLAILSFSIVNIQSLVWTTSDWMVAAILPAVVITETNTERAEASLSPLVRNDILDSAANAKAEDMAKNEYFAHYSPDGISPWFWFQQEEYAFVHAGENLAIHFTDSSEVVGAWMESPTHRANIMNGNYSEIGIGTAKGIYEGYPTVYVVQLFGTPAEVVPDVIIPISPNNASVEAIEIASVPVIEPLIVSVESGGVLGEVIETIVVSSSTPPEVTTDKQIGVEVSPTPTSVTSPGEDTYDIRDQRVIYLDHMATTTNLTPRHVDPLSTGSISGTTKPVLTLATQPHKVLQIAYIVLGVLVTFALILSIGIEIKRQHSTQIVHGVGLIAVLLLLFYIHISVSGGVLII